jgi:hypothetical protein
LSGRSSVQLIPMNGSRLSVFTRTIVRPEAPRLIGSMVILTIGSTSRYWRVVVRMVSADIAAGGSRPDPTQTRGKSPNSPHRRHSNQGAGVCIPRATCPGIATGDAGTQATHPRPSPAPKPSNPPTLRGLQIPAPCRSTTNDLPTPTEGQRPAPYQPRLKA